MRYGLEGEGLWEGRKEKEGLYTKTTVDRLWGELQDE